MEATNLKFFENLMKFLKIFDFFLNFMYFMEPNHKLIDTWMLPGSKYISKPIFRSYWAILGELATYYTVILKMTYE